MVTVAVVEGLFCSVRSSINLQRGLATRRNDTEVPPGGRFVDRCHVMTDASRRLPVCMTCQLRLCRDVDDSDAQRDVDKRYTVVNRSLTSPAPFIVAAVRIVPSHAACRV